MWCVKKTYSGASDEANLTMNVIDHPPVLKKEIGE